MSDANLAPKMTAVASVLQLTAGVGPAWYGTGLSLDELCRAIAARNWRVVLASAWRSPIDSPEQALPPLEPGERNYARVAFPTLATRRFQFSPGLLRWLRDNISHFDLVHANSLYSFPMVAGLMLARARAIPYLVTTHDVLAPVQRRRSRTRKALLGGLFMRRALNGAAAIVYSTAAERDAARPLGIKAPAAIISPGISLAPFAALPARGTFRARFLGGFEGPLVLYLGRLAEKKGLDRLIAAFAQILAAYPQARLVIAGDADPLGYRGVVERWAVAHGVRRATDFVGLLRADDKLGALADADLFVLPSRSENFATAMFEAMACRVPVVISSGVQLSAEIAAARAGLVADEPHALAAAMGRLLADPVLRRETEERGWAYAGQFEWDKTAARLTALYSEILARRGRAGAVAQVDPAPTPRAACERRPECLSSARR